MRTAAILALLAIPSMALAQMPPSPAPSSDREMLSIGGYAGYGHDIFSAGFAVTGDGALSDASDCGRFERGSGDSPLFGVIATAPLGGMLRGRAAIEYQNHSGTLRFPCVDPASIRLPNGTLVPALTDFIADVDYATVTARLGVDISPFSFPLYIGAGPTVSLVLPGRYGDREEVVAPSSAEFLSGGQVRRYGDDAFGDGTAVSLGVAASLSYRARISPRLWLMPELGGLLKLTDDIASAGLRVHTLSGSIGLLYTFEQSQEVVQAPPPIAVATLDAAVRASAVEPDGASAGTMVIRGSRVITTHLHPLLSYLFFDEGESVIPARYIRRTADEIVGFGEEQLRGMQTMDIYYNLLDIIGSRLLRYPSASVTITGTQPDAGRGNVSLAGERAAKVREYLMDVWGIDSSRLAVVARQQPASLTNPETADGMAENRRVEISSGTYQITDPVLLADTTTVLEIPGVAVMPEVRSTAGVTGWSVEVTRRGERLASTSGTGAPPAVLPLRLDSSLLGRRDDGELGVALRATDATGNVREAGGTLPVRYMVEPDSIRYGSGSYSLILFDFNSSTLRPEHLRTVMIVNARTTSSTGANVYGYTDRLGPDDRNQALSEDRARAVAGKLTSRVNDVVGRGESVLLYDNTLPEGRFYSRSVTIDTHAP